MRSLAVLAASALLHVAAAAPCGAATPDRIVANNTRAVVYIQVEDKQGNFMDAGTGFIVSQDGYVVTASHVQPGDGQLIWAVIGQREGTRYPLEPRDKDAENDTAIWQLPQSASCRYAVTMTDKPVMALERTLVLGFPGKDGLTPALVNISNPSVPPHGYIKADGFLRNGYSGGPVFNEEGNVVALVHSGAPAGGNNELVPIYFAVALLKKHGASVGVNASVPFANSCYATCRVPAHGIERWMSQSPWSAQDHEDGGGHNEPAECASMIAAALANRPDSHIDLDPGQGVEGVSGMWEKSGRNGLAHVYYDYYCKGVMKSGPVYVSKQSPECGLWD